MKYPNLSEEKKLWEKGYKMVIGLDEAGRGPLAGPVVAAAIATNPKFKNQNVKLYIKIKNLKDSKKLTPKQRNKFYKILTKHPQIKWGAGIVSEKVIDEINILEATKLAMQKSLKNLGKNLGKKLNKNSEKIGKADPQGKISGRANFTMGRQFRFLRPDFLILDGNFKLNTDTPQKSIVKADEKVFSCAAASIIAKVTRDRIMQKYHKKYPHYDFGRHKGYPTKTHYKMLKKYGYCKIHRKSFRLD